MPAASQRSWIQRLLSFVELVASSTATRPSLLLNHFIMSFTAASAAARRAFSPSWLVVSKKSADGLGVIVRRYCPTLNVFAVIESHPRYRTTAARHVSRGPCRPCSNSTLTLRCYQTLAAGRQAHHDNAYSGFIGLNSASVSFAVRTHKVDLRHSAHLGLELARWDWGFLCHDGLQTIATTAVLTERPGVEEI